MSTEWEECEQEASTKCSAPPDRLSFDAVWWKRISLLNLGENQWYRLVMNFLFNSFELKLTLNLLYFNDSVGLIVHNVICGLHSLIYKIFLIFIAFSIWDSFIARTKKSNVYSMKMGHRECGELNRSPYSM